MSSSLKQLLLPILLGIFFIFTSPPSWAQTFSINEESLVEIIAVDAETLQPHNGSLSLGSLQRSGQGIILDPAGIIVTNKHIVGNNPKHIQVTLAGGRTLEGKIIQNSQTEDLTLIKINAPFPLRAMALADPSQIQIGDPVLAFAHAHLNLQRKQSGEIIQVFRNTSSNDVAILKINISLKAGDSGGPIFDNQGLLLGVIMANQTSDTTKSYAIASNKIQQMYLKYRNATLISRL